MLDSVDELSDVEVLDSVDELSDVEGVESVDELSDVELVLPSVGDDSPVLDVGALDVIELAVLDVGALVGVLVLDSVVPGAVVVGGTVPRTDTCTVRVCPTVIDDAAVTRRLDALETELHRERPPATTARSPPRPRTSKTSTS